MKHIFRTILTVAALAALASCAKDESAERGGGTTDGPIILNQSSSALNGEIILKLKPDASPVVEKTRAAGAPATSSGIDELDRILMRLKKPPLPGKKKMEKKR